MRLDEMSDSQLRDYLSKPVKPAKSQKQLDDMSDDELRSYLSDDTQKAKPLPAWKQKKLAPEAPQKSWLDQGLDWAKQVTSEQKNLQKTGKKVDVPLKGVGILPGVDVEMNLPEAATKATAWAKGLGNVADIPFALSDAAYRSFLGGNTPLGQRPEVRALANPGGLVHDALTMAMRGLDKATKPVQQQAPAFSQAYQTGVELMAPFPNVSVAKAGVGGAKFAKAAEKGGKAAIADAAASMGLISGGQDAATQWRENKKIDPLQAALATGLGVAGGGALGGAAVLAPKAAKGARNLFNEMGQKIGQVKPMKAKPGVTAPAAPAPLPPPGSMPDAQYKQVLQRYSANAEPEAKAAIDQILGNLSPDLPEPSWTQIDEVLKRQGDYHEPGLFGKAELESRKIDPWTEGTDIADFDAMSYDDLGAYEPRNQRELDALIAEIERRPAPVDYANMTQDEFVATRAQAEQAGVPTFADDAYGTNYGKAQFENEHLSRINDATTMQTGKKFRAGDPSDVNSEIPVEQRWNPSELTTDDLLQRYDRYNQRIKAGQYDGADPRGFGMSKQGLIERRKAVKAELAKRGVALRRPKTAAQESGRVAGTEPPPPTDIIEPSQAEVDEIVRRNAPQELGQFRYNLDERGTRGYERNEQFTDIDEFPDLPDSVRQSLIAVAEAGAKKKWHEDAWQAFQSAYARKFGDGTGLVNHSGVASGVVPGEVNIGYEANKLRDQLMFDLADGAEIKAAPGIRTLGDAGYGQGKGFHQGEIVQVPDDIEAATVELLARKATFDDAAKAYKGVKGEHEANIYAMQNAYQTAFPTPPGLPPKQLQVNVNVEHPMGPGYGRVNQGVETYQARMEKTLSEGSRAQLTEFDQALKLKTTGGMDEQQWLGFLKQAADELDGNGQFSPQKILEQRAIEAARKAGFDITRAPYKTNYKLNAQAAQASKLKAQGKALAREREKLIQRGGVALGMMMDAAMMSQQEANAADGTQTKKDPNYMPWMTLAAVLATGAGTKGARALVRSGFFQRAGAIWKDTVDLVGHLDNQLANIPAANGLPQPQSQRLTESIWRHMADGQQASWGVKFDNPEQAAEALMQFRRGDVTIQQAMAGAKGTAFEHLSQPQRDAIVAQQVIRQSLARDVRAYSDRVKEAVANGSIQNAGMTAEALKALRHLEEVMAGKSAADGVGGELMSGAMGNLMDAFFFWNPEHHGTNLTDQWIAGGSRVGVRNIAEANGLLFNDKELAQLMRESNLTGGMRAERTELRAASGKIAPPSTMKRLLNTDLPSDVFNADRVALGSLLEYARLNKTALQQVGITSPAEFAKQVLRPNSKLDPTLAMAARVHMTERLSRTLGVDPFRVNANSLQRSAAAPLLIFASQPARMSRLMLSYLAEGNGKAIGTVLGMTALLGGRAAIPAELKQFWEWSEPQSYFAASHLFDEFDLHRRITGESNADKLGWAMNPLSLAVPQMAYDEIGNLVEKIGQLSKYKDWSDPEAGKALVTVASKFTSLVGGGALSAAGRMVRQGAAVDADNTTGSKNVYLSEPSILNMGHGMPKKEEMNLQEHGMSGVDLLKDLLVPGKPVPVDRLIQTRIEEKKREEAAGRGFFPIPQTLIPQVNRTQKDILREMRRQ